MTPPRRWPKRAERFRVDCLLKAMRISEMAGKAKAAVLDGETAVAVALLGDIALLANEVRELMKDAKRGKE